MFEVPVLNENNEKILCEMNGKNADMLMKIKVKYLKQGEKITILETENETAVLLVAGEKGKRFALPHSRVMIHQPMGGIQGQASDIEITAREILKLKSELYNIISTHSGQPFEKVERDSDRDYWMIAKEAEEYGMIDKVLVNPKKD